MPGLAALALVASVTPPVLPREPGPAPERSTAPPSRLSWTVAPECPDAERFVELLRRFLPTLGPVVVDASLGPTLAHIEVEIVEAEPGLWRATLELRSELGSEARTFEAERCELAAEAAALVISVVLDPVLVVSRTGIPPTTEPDPDPDLPKPNPDLSDPDLPDLSDLPDLPDPEPTLHVVESERGDPPPELALRIGASLRIGGGYGPLRAGSWAIGAQLALIGEGYRVELDGAYHPPLTLSFELGTDPDTPLDGRFDAWRVGLGGCWVPTRGRLEFPQCGLVEGGQVRGEGLAPIPVTTREAQPYLALGLASWLWWAPIARLAIGAGAEGFVPLLARGFSIDGVEAQRTTVVGVRGMAAVEVRLP